MKSSGTLIVFAKEMKDILRDRRTLISMVLVPILFYPIISIGMGAVISSQIEKSRAAVHDILVLPEGAAPALRESLLAEPQIRAVPGDSIRALLLEYARADSQIQASWVEAVFSPAGESLADSLKQRVYYAAIAEKWIRAAVELPVGLRARIAAGDSVVMGIFADETDIKSESAGDNIRNWARVVRDSLVDLRLAAEGMDRRALHPYWIASTDVAPIAKKSGVILAMILPYMLMILTMTGGMYPALDITAGEKERNTLETLLAAPVARWELAVGKFLAVLTAGLVTMLLATTSMTFSMTMGAAQFDSGSGTAIPFAISATTIGWVVLLMIPMSVFFSALLIAVAIAARSFKEGQSYVTPILMGVIIPAMVSFVPGIELNWGLAVVPVVNLCLALKEVLLGIHDPLLIAVVFFSTTVYAAFALFVATRMFERESVLFRT